MIFGLLILGLGWDISYVIILSRGFFNSRYTE